MDIKPRRTNPQPSIQRRQKRQVIGDFVNTRDLKQKEIDAGTTVKDEVAPQPFQLDTSDIDDNQDETKKPSFLSRLSFSNLKRNFFTKKNL